MVTVQYTTFANESLCENVFVMTSMSANCLILTYMTCLNHYYWAYELLWYYKATCIYVQKLKINVLFPPHAQSLKAILRPVHFSVHRIESRISDQQHAIKECEWNTSQWINFSPTEFSSQWIISNRHGW